MEKTVYKLENITINYDKKRKPLSAQQRAGMKGNFRYFGAQSVIDYVNDYLFDGEYLLIAEDGENLKSNKQKIAQIVTGQFWLNNHAHIVQTNELCNIRYLGYWLNAADISGYITGSAQPKLSQANLNAIEIELPDRSVQDRIVSILATLDEKIEINNQINRNLFDQAMAIFEQEYLAYSKVKLGETNVFVTDYVANGSFKSLKDNVTILEEKDYAYFIRNVDLKAKTFPRFVSQHSYEFLSKSKLVGGEVIISNVGDVGSVFLCPKLDGPMTLGNNMIMLNSTNHNYYLYLYFISYIGQGMISGITGGSAQPKFNKTDFKSLEINFPNDVEVEEFNSKVVPLLEYMANIDRENQKLQATRDTLLPRLMSGELDVSDLDI